MVLTVSASNGTVTVSEVYNGDTKLTKTTHYTVSGGAVTIKTTYLATLTEGSKTITFGTDQGDITATVAIIDTTDE